MTERTDSVTGRRIPIVKPPRGPILVLVVVYLAFLVGILLFAALWIKVIFLYVAVFFLSTVLIKGYVQLTEGGLVVFPITRFFVPFEQIKSVEIAEPRFPAPDAVSLHVFLKAPQKVLFSYALPVKVTVSDVKVEVARSDAEALRTEIASRISR
jgi:hypothetical protein